MTNGSVLAMLLFSVVTGMVFGLAWEPQVRLGRRIPTEWERVRARIAIFLRSKQNLQSKILFRWWWHMQQERLLKQEHRLEQEQRARWEHRHLARLLIAIAVRLLPPSERDRYLEEFRAELLDVPYDTRLHHALSLLRGVFVLRLRRNKAGDATVRRAKD